MEQWMNLLAAGLAVAGGLFGLGQWVRFRTGRERQAAIGQGFTSIIAGLGSSSSVERLASAALLRRFFDRGSEYGAGGMPYARDAVKVAAAVLRSEPSGPVQKLLADGLAEAPTLFNADFQRTNLRNCYWGVGADGAAVDASGADFFGADLTSASLRGARLRGAIFRESYLTNTVLVGCDLTDANFTSADLRGARLDGAVLTRATFSHARHLPPGLASHLDATGRFVGDAVFLTAPTTAPLAGDAVRVFVSAPSAMADGDQVLLAQVVRGLQLAATEMVRFLPEEYGQAPPLEEITRRIAACDAVLVVGAPQVHAADASLRAGTPYEQRGLEITFPTPWNQVEAGVAAGLDKPILIVRSGVSGGVFDLAQESGTVAVLDVDAADLLAHLDESVAAWVRGIPVATSALP